MEDRKRVGKVNNKIDLPLMLLLGLGEFRLLLLFRTERTETGE
jgi:hypothetical protein